MANGLKIGDTFLLPTPPNDLHLFVAVALAPNGKYLCVNVTSYRPTSDTSCVLEPNCPDMHSFIKHKSVINYKRAREIEAATLETLISSGYCIPKGPFSTSVLQQIQQGGLNSTRLKNKYKEYIKLFIAV